MNNVGVPAANPDEVPAIKPVKSVWLPSLFVLVLGFVAITVMFFPTVREMLRIWEDSVAFQHCWLIPVVVAWLVWERRRDLGKLQPRAYLPGAIFTGLAGAVWLIGWAASVNFVEEFGYLGMLQGLVLATLGPTVTRGLLFPLGFALFAVPFGEEFVPFLQKITAFLTVGLLKLSGLNFINDGVFISVLIPGSTATHNFQIAQECSGIRYITAMAATATLFANIGFKTWSRRALLMLIALVVPIIANGIRAFGIVYIAHSSNMKYATGVDHILYGWVFFALVMALVIFIGYRFMDKPLDAPAMDVGPLVAADARASPKRLPFWLGGVAAAAIAALIAFYAKESVTAPIAATVQAIAPPQIKGWTATSLPTTQWNPTYDGATQVLQQDYVSDGGDVVTLYVAWYDHQAEDREMIRYGNGTTGGELDWTWAASIAPPRLSESPAPWAYQINGGGAVRDVYQWYWVNGKLESSNGSAKIAGALARLLYGEKKAATIVLSAERFDGKPTESTLTAFANGLGPIDKFAHRVANENNGD
jgi:exosortase A